MSAEERDKIENQAGALVMLFVLFSYAANIVNDKIQNVLFRIGKEYTRESKMDYNTSKGLSKRLSEIYDRLIADAIPAIELKGDDQSDMAKFDEIQKGANNFIELMANAFSAIKVDKDTLSKLNSYAQALSNGNEFLDSETLDSFKL